ncbi:MAG: hypothetical protein M3Y48_11230 [Actinomycetota bacterium]|nr:hypothetical protein [Actinomycetota bacterium]
MRVTVPEDRMGLPQRDQGRVETEQIMIRAKLPVGLPLCGRGPCSVINGDALRCAASSAAAWPWCALSITA